MENGFNEHNRPVARDISIALSEKKVNSEIKKTELHVACILRGGYSFPCIGYPGHCCARAPGYSAGIIGGFPICQKFRETIQPAYR